VTTRDQIAAFLAAEFPQTKCVVLRVGERGAAVSHEVGPDELRPGGTVSGPILMAVADVALYVALLGEIGIVPLAVTTSLTINFLRKPEAGRAVIGECRLLIAISLNLSAARQRWTTRARQVRNDRSSPGPTSVRA